MPVKAFIKYIFFIPLFSIAQQYNFHNYSVKDGVPQSQVFSLLQDSRGYLWMGTRGGGLSRYNGISFKSFTVKDSLVNNYVFCIKEDAQHNLWIGTDNGFSKYNGIRFVSTRPAGDSSKVSVYTIDIDKKNRKWLATNVGLLYYDDKGITNVSQLMQDHKTFINTLLVDANDNIWYGTGSALFRITENNGRFSREKFDKSNGFTNNSISVLKQDAKGNLWIGTHGDGVYVYNGNKFYRIDLELELYKQTIYDICFDDKGNVWLATLNNGVAQYNIESKKFSWITENEGLSNNHVRSIIQDKSGNYWFGTSGGGVCNYFGKQFTVYDKSSGLAGNYIYSIFRDSKGRLWTGTSDKGVTIYDSSRFTNISAANGFANVKVKAIGEDAAGNIFLGTDGQGLFIFNGMEFKELSGFERNYIRAIINDRSGNVWVATAGNGLYKISPEGQMKNFQVKDGLLSNRLTSLYCDKQDRLWYATENSGLGMLSGEKILKIRFTTKEGLPSNSVRCLVEDKKGYLWGGTAGEGIFCFPLYQGDYRISKYNYANGLTSSNIYLLTVDGENNLITGTETGLDHIFADHERKPVQIKHYGNGEGFTGIETCVNSVFNDADGTIWFGTINGLTKYNPSNKIRNEHAPVTTITNVELNYQPLSNTEFRNFVGDWNQVKDLRLPYDQNRLTIHFVGINFSNSEAVLYKIKLEGLDKEWNPVTRDQKITYPDLRPGNYTFKLMACNEDGVWTAAPVTLKFSIIPPWWQSWWFITLVVVSVLSIIWIIFRWRVNSIKEKAKEQQDKITLEKEIMELEQKALRLQMNPHFIFNALNSIQSQIGADNEQTARYYLAKFSRLMRQILDNSRNTSITLEEEVSTLENYLLIEKFCNGDRFDYKITVDENIEKDYVKIPPMILQPFIENAIKHGLKSVEGKHGMIEVDFKERGNMLECSVTDNGIGRKKADEMNRNSKETYHKSTALAVTRERLDLIRKDKNVESLEIFDRYYEDGSPAGTKVVVRIPIN
jgi:ligand-binding sensor domain-containing protein/two-component sensor histidine kinase